MKTVANIARIFLVSSEFIVLMSALLMIEISPQWLQMVSARVALNNDLIKYLSLAPIAVFVWVISHSRKMLFPEADEKQIFQNWEDYQTFKMAITIGVIYSFLFAIIGLSTWIMDWKKSPNVAFTWSIASLAGALIVGLSFYQAEIMVNELFRKTNDNKPQSR